MTTLRDRFRFHLEHGGYCTPPGRAACALGAARAESLLEEAQSLGVAHVSIVYDSEPYDPGDVCTDEDAARRFASGEWSGPFGLIVAVGESADDPDAESSLWGIVVGPYAESDPYMRVVASDLASELADDLRQAIGDARDAE